MDDHLFCLDERLNPFWVTFSFQFDHWGEIVAEEEDEG